MNLMTTKELKEYWQYLENERLELVFNKSLNTTGLNQICRIQLHISQELKRRNENVN